MFQSDGKVLKASDNMVAPYQMTRIGNVTLVAISETTILVSYL